MLKKKCKLSLQTFLNRLEDDFQYACSSYERLHTRSNVTQYTATTKKFSSDQWMQLKLRGPQHGCNLACFDCNPGLI